MDPRESPQFAQGIVLSAGDAGVQDAARARVLQWLEHLGLARYVQVHTTEVGACRFVLDPGHAQQWAPGADTTGLCKALGLETQGSEQDLEREIVLALLLAPVPFVFPNDAELLASVRVRRNIVAAARCTGLAFHTSKIERPMDCWAYDEDRGFTVRVGVPLIDALRKATQPPSGAERYAFSCYRATEYVILLGIALELQDSNPALLQDLQRQWESRAIMSGQFHEVFLREYGSMEWPLPPRYYVPGDRVWFRNPDEHSSDASGYEGSWVFYLGGGLFSNFWDPCHPYDLVGKCVEIYHWRHGTYRDAEGDLRMDETVVAGHVCATLEQPQERDRIVAQMMRLREPRGVYVAGGCIDSTREYPRWVCPGTADLVLPAD